MKPELSIDIETYSEESIQKAGMYKYVESDSFEILLFSYSYNHEPVQCVDLAAGEEIPDEIIEAIEGPNVIKKAYNAQFERVCLQKHLGKKLSAAQWECTMIKAAMIGLPMGLDFVAKVLNLKEQKDAEGAALIRYFCTPCKPTKKNEGRTRNLPEHDPERWERFKAYCVQDVVVEMAIGDKISWFQIPAFEKKLYTLDQQINDRGVLINSLFVRNAIRFDMIYSERLTKEAVALTGLDNPNSVAQIKEWIWGQTGDVVASLNKKEIPKMLESADSTAVKQLLLLRQQMSKTSVKKYSAMVRSLGADKRVRGLLQFYGASRTGRWAGRLIQVQNLRKNELPDLDLARQFVLDGDIDSLELLFGSVPDILSQLIRTSFVAPDDHRFIITDFSAIEARVIAWLAGEKWRLDVFNTHGKIYEASGAQMFKVPIEKVTKTSEYRSKAKIAELALGYQGGPDALKRMGALEMGIDEAELPKIVRMWRNANRKICEYWEYIGNCAIAAVEDGIKQNTHHGITFHVEHDTLFITLPSGRMLAYYKPRMAVNRFGSMSLSYEGLDDKNKWVRIDTYGGKLVENIVQGVARDLLADAMIRLDKEGLPIIMHVHDEVVIELHWSKIGIDRVNKIMSQPVPWAKGLPLAADSNELPYYRKD